MKPFKVCFFRFHSTEYNLFTKRRPSIRHPFELFKGKTTTILREAAKHSFI